MLIWEMEKIANGLGKTIYGSDESKMLNCPICGRGIGEYWSQLRCLGDEHHGFYLENFVRDYIKKNISPEDEIIELVKHIFVDAVGVDIDEEFLPCFKCSKGVKRDGYLMKCENGHKYSFREYLARYIDFLDGYVQSSKCCLSGETIK